MKSRHLFIALLLLLLAAGCKKDEVEPRVQFTSHTDMEKVWNREVLVVDAIDNEMVVKVEFRVNGTDLGVVEASPWEIELDTRSYADGQLTVSATAYDAEGNTSEEASLNLIVENILFSVSIEEGYLYEDEDGITDTKYVYYLKSSDGTTLGSAIIGNGDSWECRRPENFNDEKFDFGIGYFRKSNVDPLYFNGWVMTFMDMEPGTNLYESSAGTASFGDYVGECSFSAADIKQNEPYTLSNRGFTTWGSIYGDSAFVPLYENSNEAYFYYKAGTNGYYRFYKDLLTGKHYSIRSSDLNSSMMPYHISNDYLAYDNLYAYVYAYPTTGEYNSYDRTLLYTEGFSFDEEKEIMFHYPVGSEAVKDFKVSVNVYVNDYITHYYDQAGPLPSEVPDMGADIQAVWLDLPGQVTATTSGMADIQWGNIYVREADNRMNFMCHGPTGGSIRIPTIPAEISAAYNIPVISNSTLYYYTHYLTEHSEVSDYEGFARNWARMDYIEPYFSSGTVSKEVAYFEYYGSQKSSRDSQNRLHADRLVEMAGLPGAHIHSR